MERYVIILINTLKQLSNTLPSLLCKPMPCPPGTTDTHVDSWANVQVKLEAFPVSRTCVSSRHVSLSNKVLGDGGLSSDSKFRAQWPK